MSEEVLEINEEDEYWLEEKKMYMISWKFMTKMARLRQVKRHAVKVWKENFTKVLGASNEGAGGRQRRVAWRRAWMFWLSG